MDSLDYWRLCDDFTVTQAALLIAGHDPTGQHEFVLRNTNQPENFDAVFSALTNAINTETLKANVKHDGDMNGNNWVLWDKSTIDVNDLKCWLESKGFKNGFFFPSSAIDADYLDSSNEHYAPKLAAAVRAWQAVSKNSELVKGKTFKQALDKWLREHGNMYGLTDIDGNPINQAIEEISKVANCKPSGGAPKTPE